MILDLPELKLQGEDLLDAYGHRAQHRPDWLKQAFFGRKLLDLAVTNHWLEKTDSVEEVSEKLDKFLEDDDLLRRCIEKYQLESKLARVESTPVGIQECKDFLCINAAKLWSYGGMSEVQGWISALIQPGSVPPRVPHVAGALSVNELRLSSPDPSGSSSRSRLASANTAVNESDPLGFITLQIFNEHAGQKKKHNISWRTAPSGDAHCLLWTAECFLDGQSHGVGQGSSKKIAQENAARNVWRAMGWSSVNPDPSASPPQSPGLPTASPSVQTSESSLPPAYSQGDTGLDWLTLAIFSHVANERRQQLEWRQEQSGEPHIPTWRVICILNGQEKGSGIGKNTKDAKLLAVREAWRNMGWTQ